MTQFPSLTNPIFVALDTRDLARAQPLAAALTAAGGLKLGLEFFAAHGAAGVRAVQPAGVPLFLDLKFHDIPNTVAGAVRSVVPLQPTLLTVHAAGGRAMLTAAVDAAGDESARLGVPCPQIVAVTVLTSLDGQDLAEMGVSCPLDEQVLRLATLAAETGLAGVVCSPHETARLRDVLGPDFLLIVPGVRPTWAAAGDQKRVMTPREAREAGATVLVVGRPITASLDPAAVLARILGELS